MIAKSEQGQTMVEYILLLAVAVSLVMTFYNSEAYRRLFGDNGAIGKKMKAESEFSYRHASMLGTDVPRDNRDGTIHPSYYDDGSGGSSVGTRFFGPKNPYP